MTLAPFINIDRDSGKMTDCYGNETFTRAYHSFDLAYESALKKYNTSEREQQLKKPVVKHGWLDKLVKLLHIDNGVKHAH